jgi:hypothetical protein
VGVVDVVAVAGAGVDAEGNWDWDCGDVAASAESNSILGGGGGKRGEIREEGGEERAVDGDGDGLDFGLEALFFFGCALDRAGVLCVRLCACVI